MNHPRAAEIKSNTSNLSKSEKLVGVESIESKPTATSLDFLARSLSSPVVLNNLANNWHSLKWKKKKKNQEKPTTASDAVAYLQWQLPKKITIGCGMKLWLTNSAIALEILLDARLPFRDFPIFRLTTFVIGKCHCFVPTSAFMYIVNLVSGPDPLTSFTLHIFA